MRILITDLSDPTFHKDKVVRVLSKEPLPFIASLISKDVPGMVEVAERIPLGRRKYVSFQATITGMGGTEWEPNVGPPSDNLEALEELVEIMGSDNVSLRYDPIVPGVNNGLSEVCRTLYLANEAGVRRVTVSVLDVYGHRRSDVERLLGRKVYGKHFPATERRQAIDMLLKVAKHLNMEIAVCCEEGYPQPSGCDWIVQSLKRLGLSPEALISGTQRQLCGCPKMSQILSYSDQCAHGCVYCYRRG